MSYCLSRAVVHPFRRVLCSLIIALGVAFGVVPTAQAHPHAWIYVDTTFVMNADDELTAIQQKWMYDNLLTEAVLAELRNDAPDKDPDVNAYAVQRLTTLGGQGYFMRVTAGDEPVDLSDVSDISGKRVDDEIHIEFTATLAQPVRVAGEPVVVKVFDPSYFIEILQDPDREPAIAGTPDARCTVELKYPQPSSADYARALAIDSGLKVEPEFGELFAEGVHLVCL